jgi:hypothetical protein
LAPPLDLDEKAAVLVEIKATVLELVFVTDRS